MYWAKQYPKKLKRNCGQMSSKSLDHLGIVVTVCKEIGLADEINRIVGVDSHQKVTCGEAVVAIA